MLKLIMKEDKQGLCGVTQGQTYRRGLCIPLQKKGLGIGILKIHVFPRIWGREICDSETKDVHAWLCATRLQCTCMQLVGCGRGWG